MPSTLIMASAPRSRRKNGMTKLRSRHSASRPVGVGRVDKAGDDARHAADRDLAVALVFADQVPRFGEIDGGQFGVAWRRYRVGIAGQQQHREIGRERRLEIRRRWALRATPSRSPSSALELQCSHVACIERVVVDRASS